MKTLQLPDNALKENALQDNSRTQKRIRHADVSAIISK